MINAKEITIRIEWRAEAEEDPLGRLLQWIKGELKTCPIELVVKETKRG